MLLGVWEATTVATTERGLAEAAGKWLEDASEVERVAPHPKDLDPSSGSMGTGGNKH